MQLLVVRQTYDSKQAAELAYTKRKHYLRYITNQLKLKHIKDDYIQSSVEDILQNGIELLLSYRFDCANEDEAIVEAMTMAVQNAVREVTKRKEVTDIIKYSNGKDEEKEVSRWDLLGGSLSVEQEYISRIEGNYTLQDVIELAESSRYRYGLDVLLNVLLRAGVIKGLWKENAVNGILVGFDSVLPAYKYRGDISIARVVSAAAESSEKELIKAMQQNLSRCDLMLCLLGYNVDEN